jgi:hypothetical protein
MSIGKLSPLQERILLRLAGAALLEDVGGSGG